MIRALIFDVFGVIYPQAVGKFFIDKQNLFKDGLSFLDELNVKIDLGQISRAEFFKAIEKESGLSAANVQAEIDQRLVLDKELAELIEKLKTKYLIGALSNAGKEEIEVIYRDKIDWLFDDITVSYDVGMVKPDPKIFYLAAQRLGVKTGECLFIDDSSVNLDAAKSVGMEVLLYPKYGEIPSELQALV